jgi:hypothetical protein
VIVQSGSQIIARLLAGGPAVHLGIGVGSDDHPESHLSTALGADGVAGAARYRPVDVTYPHVTGGGLLLQASFDPDEAPFGWWEWCVFAAESPVTAHHELARTGVNAALLSRTAPVAALRAPQTAQGGVSAVREQGKVVLRVPLAFHITG